MGRKSAPRATAEAHDASIKTVSLTLGRASQATTIQQVTLVLRVFVDKYMLLPRE